MKKTASISFVDKNIIDAFQIGDLASQITPITENLALVASNTAFRDLSKLLVQRFPDNELQQINYLKELIEPIKDRYDSIYLDVPPTISDYSDNAMLAADYCIIVLQTQELSLDGAQTYISYMQYLVDTYDIDLDVLSIVPCMLKQGGRVDSKVLEQAKELYGSHVLETIVKYQERLKVSDVQGIELNYNANGKVDMWDMKAHQVFLDTLEELDEHQKILQAQ